MSVVELIKERKSVRSYAGKPLGTELISSIREYVNQLNPPFGAKARIEIASTQVGNQPVKLGTYGVISGAADFLVLINEGGVMSDVGAGYMFEQVVLYCTELGLGTCWLGGTINRKDFMEQVKLKQEESIAIISPVGFRREKRRLVDTMMRVAAGSDNRKPFGSLFFKENFDVPLDEKAVDRYKTPLEMVRLAPSASNKQPWRVVLKDEIFHFYHRVGRFSANDIGIALCNFEQTCQEMS
jgi:nitroreductase